MGFDIKRLECYDFVVTDHIADGARLLPRLAAAGVDLLAFKAVPIPPRGAQFTLVPRVGSTLTEAARSTGVTLNGPHAALLVTGGEKPGALSVIYQKLAQAGIRVNQASGIADINGGYGVVLQLNSEDCDGAIAALTR